MSADLSSDPRGRAPRPPAVPRVLLERTLRGPTREYLLGDLEERFRAMARRTPLRARLWYWRQAAMAVLLPLPGPAGVPDGWGPGSAGADFARALRALRARPFSAVAAVLPLGLGIGVVVTAFSIVWGTVLAGLPFEEADRLVHFERARLEEGQLSLAVTPHDYLAWREAQRSFEDLGAYVEREVSFPGEGGPPDRHTGVAITPNSFRLLRVEAALGRTFTTEEAEPGAPDVLVLSDRLWRGRFGADPGIVGREIVANGRPTTVVGVMPGGFGFPVAEAFWTPLRIDLTTLPRGAGRLDVFGRLRDGGSLASARAEFDGITEGIAAAWPDTNAGISASLRTFHDEYVGEEFTGTVVRLLLGALLVLVVSCANVANLLLVRGLHRRRDLAVRRALGATSGSIVRQLVAEALVLSAVAATLGVAIAAYGIAWFNRVGTGVGVFALPHGSDSLFWWDVSLNGPTLLATVGVAAATAVLAGLAPALEAAGASSFTRRGAGHSAGGWLQRGMLVGQLALTAGLLLAAGFVARSAANVAGAADRLAPDDALVLRLSLPSAARPGEGYADLADQLRFVEELQTRLASDPSARGASFAAAVPLESPRRWPVRVEGVPDDPNGQPEAGVVTVGPEYFDVFGVEAVAGRVLGPGDRAGSAPAAVVNQRFVELHLSSGPAVGTRIRLGGADAAEPWLEVVGVVPDLWERPGAPAEEAGVYVPLAQIVDGDPMVRVGPWGLAYPTIAVGEARPGALDAAALGRHVYALDPTLPVRSVETMGAIAERRLGRYRVWGRFWTAFAVTALFLAALGIFGAFSFSVSQRTSEIGVRRALGATGASVRRTVMARALTDVALGTALGLWVGTVLTRGLRQLLYGIEPDDPAVFAAVVGVVALVGLVASWIPAGRAARIDPREAMRAE